MHSKCDDVVRHAQANTDPSAEHIYLTEDVTNTMYTEYIAQS